jgi:hypothetical protein
LFFEQRPLFLSTEPGRIKEFGKREQVRMVIGRPGNVYYPAVGDCAKGDSRKGRNNGAGLI